MPAKVTMSLNNNNFNRFPMAAFVKATKKPPPPPPSHLNSSMVGRIHAIKPGCGSCGH